jgi:hypothetical protein
VSAGGAAYLRFRHRPTCACNRPLRARDRRFFSAFSCGARAAADAQAVGRFSFCIVVSFLNVALGRFRSQSPCHAEETNRAWIESSWCWVWCLAMLSPAERRRALVVLGVVPSAWFRPAPLLVAFQRWWRMPQSVSNQRCRPTRPCSGRALRHEIGPILARGFVPSVVPIPTARR